MLLICGVETFLHKIKRFLGIYVYLCKTAGWAAIVCRFAQ